MMKRVILGLAVFIAAGVGHAAGWVTIGNASSGGITQVDEDSITKPRDGQYRLAWRIGANPDKLTAIFVGTADCLTESLHLESETRIEQDPVLARYSGNTVIDYIAGTRATSGRVSALSAQDKQRRHLYPSNGGEPSSLLRYLCGNSIPSTAQRETLATALQEKLGCNALPWKGTVLCQKDPKSVGALYELTSRFEQASSACSLPSEESSLILRDWYLSLSECRDAGGCLPVVMLQTSGVVADLAAAAERQQCTYFRQSLATAQEHVATRAALANFRACVTKQIPALDDRMSPADTIATAVFGVCEGLLPVRMNANQGVRANSLPAISAEVLQFRQLLLRQQQKPKPQGQKPKSFQG